MNTPLYIYDPTMHDLQSKVRGIGRYLQLLKEYMSDIAIFTSNIHTIPYSALFLNPFFNVLQLPLTLKRIAKKQIAVIHDLTPLKYPKHFPIGIRGTINVLANRFVLRNYDSIITDSEASKKDIIKILRVSPNKIKVVYPTLPKEFTHQTLEHRNSQFCLYVGDATWNKNLITLAKAIQLANIPCVFVGKVFFEATGGAVGGVPDSAQRSEHWRGGEPRQAPLSYHPWQKELFQFLSLTSNNPLFIFPGFVSDEKLIQFYQDALCNILVSHDEGFGFSYLEAASFGTPSILSDIPVFHEIAQGAAIFVDQNNPESIAEKIHMLNTDKNLRDELGIMGKERSGFFSPHNFRNGFLSVL